MRQYAFDIYDCFTDQRFGGNVGGLVWDAAQLTPDQMLAIAREIAAPVTGFITAQDGNDVTARFFMPGGEIAMCGHVTLAIFIHLAQPVGPVQQDFTLKVAAGDVPVIVSCEGGTSTIMMSLSVPQPFEINVDEAALLNALGANPIQRILVPIGAADAGLKHVFVPFDRAEDVASLKPDFAALRQISGNLGVHTIAAFAMTGPDRLTIRDFCPTVGIDETPASGTTNGALAGYLLAQGLIEARNQTLIARQGQTIGRPSTIRSDITVVDGQITELRIGGTAVHSLSGQIAPL